MDSSELESNPFVRTKAIQNQIEELEAYFRSARHYSQRDLRDIGRDISLAIYHFSNLSGQNDDGAAAYKAFGHLSDEVDDANVPVLDAEYLHRPILAPAVFSVTALDHWNTFCGTNRSSKRALSEISIRQELNIEPPRDFSSADGSNNPDFYFKEAEDPALTNVTEDDDSQGSDSDPSGDELPLKEVLRQGGLKKILGSDSEIMNLMKVKRRTKRSNRPSSASVAWVDHSRRNGKGKLVRSLSATATRHPVEAKDQTIKATSSLPSRNFGFKQSLQGQRYVSRTYEKSNYFKATENTLRRQATEQFVILPPAGFMDSPANNAASGPRRLSGDESLDKSLRPLSQKESKVTLRRRGIFFPERIVK